MRVFYAFLVIVTAAILWMLPITSAIYDFRTDVQVDSFSSTTGVGQTTENVTLSEELYDDDTQTIDISSSISNDSPVFGSYNATTRLLGTSGLSANTTRILTVAYDIDALIGNDAVNNLLDQVPLIWILCIAVFPLASLAAIFTGRAR